jgi:CheY-like chemotaxis protein
MTRHLFIVSADDDIDDQDLIQEAIQSLNIDHEFARVSDGLKLLNYLKELTENKKTLPDIIFLDLNMPFVNGRDAIRIIKSQTSPFRSIPVMILTTSANQEDMKHCLNCGADSYLVKPNSFTDLKKVLSETLSNFVSG